MGLPKGWSEHRLTDIAEVRLGRQRSPKNAEGPHMKPYLRAASVTWRGLDLSDILEMNFSPREQETFRLKAGDILLSEASGSPGEVGKPAIWRDELPECYFQNTLIRVRSSPELTSFLYYQFLWWATSGRFADESRGVGIHHLGSERLATMQVVTAPTRDRESTVAEIETQFSRLDATEARLKRALVNLKRARASVLNAAVEGRLVPTEAELADVEGREFEPAASLLGRVLATKGPGKTRRRLEAPIVDTTMLPMAPHGWSWTTVDQLASQDQHSLTDGPFGSNLKTEHYQDAGPRVIRLQNIGPGIFRDEKAHISQEHFQALRRHAVLGGDVLIASLGETLPRACIVPEWLGPAIVKADCIRFQPDLRLAIPKYLNIALNAPPIQERTTAAVHGVGRPRLGLTGIREIALPLPPLAEQHRIVAEVDRRLSVLDRLEARITANLTRCKRLRQAILKRAFEGRLVPQDLP